MNIFQIALYLCEYSNIWKFLEQSLRPTTNDWMECELQRDRLWHRASMHVDDAEKSEKATGSRVTIQFKDLERHAAKKSILSLPPAAKSWRRYGWRPFSVQVGEGAAEGGKQTGNTCRYKLPRCVTSNVEGCRACLPHPRQNFTPFHLAFRIYMFSSSRLNNNCIKKLCAMKIFRNVTIVNILKEMKQECHAEKNHE